MSKDLKYTFFGKSFDNSTGEKLYIKKDMTQYISKAHFTYGKGKDEYLLFTDPECPFCKKFEKKLLNASIENKIKIHYFLYPLTFHKKAIPMSRYILSQKDNSSKLKAVKEILVDDSNTYINKKYTQNQLKGLNTQLQNIKNITLEVVIKGTPTLFSIEGKRININKFLKEYIK